MVQSSEILDISKCGAQSLASPHEYFKDIVELCGLGTSMASAESLGTIELTIQYIYGLTA